MSNLDNFDLRKKYEQKGSRVKDLKDLTKALQESKVTKAAKQTVAGFKSQWSGINDKGEVGMGKGTPGIYYNTVALPAMAGIVDEKYAPDFAVAADKKAGKIKEAVRKDMGIDEPKGALEQYAYAGGEMLGQAPIPGSLMAKIVGGVKKMGMAGKVAAAPIEYLSPTIDPRAINYGIGTAFGGTMGVVGEPEGKALGGLIQKYEDGGKVSKVKTFFSAVDKAIETLKQKKGTGEQILKQLETTPGVKREELESRGIKQKLVASPKITQEELQKTAKVNKPAIPKRIKLSSRLDPDWKPDLSPALKNVLDDMRIEPVINPENGNRLGFLNHDTGDILDGSDIKGMTYEELGFPIDEKGLLVDEAVDSYKNLMKAINSVTEDFNEALADSQTKFARYSKSQGKDNYREVLLQHMDTNPSGASAMRSRLEELLTSPGGGEASYREIDDLLERLGTTRESYNSSHWNQPDVLAHYRVSDMTGPNGEKVLYVDEIQSDWHQGARDVRKKQVKNLLANERESINAQAVEQLGREVGNTDMTQKNMTLLKKIENALTKERKAQLEKEVDENFGYRGPEDEEKLYQVNSNIERIRRDGISPKEIAEYYTPGKIIANNARSERSFGGAVKVLSFDAGEGSSAYKSIYDQIYERNLSMGVGEEVAARNARKNALEKTKNDWLATLIDVNPKTGEPVKGAVPFNTANSPEGSIMEDLRKEASAIESKVPDAPFKKNWHELAIKDILDLAANEGYDKVAFSPGIEQVKRYSNDLRKTVDRIHYLPSEDGGTIVTAFKGEGAVFEGKVFDGSFVGGTANGKTLSEVFGSSIAKQIEEGAPDLQEAMKANPEQVPKGVIKGDDLTVGGEGMKSFYDKRLPDYVKEYGRKEFKAPTGYMEIEGKTAPKTYSFRDLQAEEARLQEDDPFELMEMTNGLAEERASQALTRQGIREEGMSAEDWSDALAEEVDNHMADAHAFSVRQLAERNLKARLGKTEKQRLFSIDVTPEMKEKITTQGQKLYATAPAVGLGATQVPQQPAAEPEVAPEPAPEEQPQASPEAPEAFQEGGKVGNMKNAAESFLRVLHGSPTKVRIEPGKPMDVTTEESYAMKRARDKMDNAKLQGPPVMNKFDIPAKKLLRFEEQYSPEDVALMRRYFNKLPEGQAMTGEEIYDAAGGKAYVLDGIAKAGGFAGYERPAQPVTGSGNAGNWYRVTDQTALTRKARGGLMHLRRTA